MWQQWINALLGLWVIVLALLGLAGDTMAWTLAITGLAIAALGAWGQCNTIRYTVGMRNAERKKNRRAPEGARRILLQYSHVAPGSAQFLVCGKYAEAAVFEG